MKKLIHNIKSFVRMFKARDKWADVVWKELVELHKEAGWQSGYFDHERYVETRFLVDEGDTMKSFYYFVDDQEYRCRVKILDNYPVDCTTDLFILATHFNNLLNFGCVRVNTQAGFVEYCLNVDLQLVYLDKYVMHHAMIKHHDVTRQVYWAFQRLLNSEDDPALIIADVLKLSENQPE